VFHNSEEGLVWSVAQRLIIDWGSSRCSVGMGGREVMRATFDHRERHYNALS